jgi:hypothetical protein
MSSAADEIRRLLDRLEAELEESRQLAASAAEAMESIYRDAAAKVEADRAALIATGVQQERERVLLAIQLVGEHFRADGTNATALGALRRMVEGGE